MMMVYQFKDGAHLKGDAQAVGERLAALEARGRLTPESVLRDAKCPDSVLHPQFEWDDSKAANEYRLWQARQIIRVSVTVIPNAEKEYHAYVSLKDDRKQEGGGYRSTVSVLKHSVRRDAMLREALEELDVFRRKYAILTELAPVFEAIVTVGATVRSKDKKVTRRREALAVA